MIMHNQDGFTALHWAASRGHTAVVTVLLDRGADITATDKVSILSWYQNRIEEWRGWN